MTYVIKWTEEQEDEVEKQYDENVRNIMLSALESKNKQIKHKNTDEALRKRFHRDIDCGHFTILEVSFAAASKNFRIIVLLFDGYEVLPYYGCVPKNNSEQNPFIERIKENSKQIYDSFT